MPRQYYKVLKIDYDSVISYINEARKRWGLSTFLDTNVAINKIIYASTIQNFQSKLQEAKTASGAPTDISGLTATAGSTLITAQLLNDFITKSTEIKNYCACNCNYCTCNCQYCTCDCQYSCTCNCQYSCTCDCQYSCTCNCQYSCTCDCQYSCTCNCQYSCTCNCQYSCTCNCQYSCTCNCNNCTCNCNDCFCYCFRPGPPN